MVESTKIDLYHHFGDGDAKLDRILAAIGSLSVQITQQGKKIMATLQDLQDAVTNETTVEQGVLTLLKTLTADLTAAIATGATPAALQDIIDQVNANAKNLASAVVANTPVYP